MEFKADQYAVNAFKDCKFIRNGKKMDHGDDITHGLQHALIKAFKKNSANLNPDWLYALCTQSHPSLYERINAIRATNCSQKSIVGYSPNLTPRVKTDDEEKYG